jgi:hypothetical protein
MKKILILLFLCGSATLSQGQELLAFGGYHTHLFGYTDERYVGNDKGDYLKTSAYYSGAEFLQKGFRSGDSEANSLVLGGSVLLYVQNGFNPLDLYAVSGNGHSFGAKTVPANVDDRASRFQLSMGAFGGYSDQWWGAQGGITVFVKGFEEKVRRKYNSLGVEVDAAGRGWVFGDGSLILPSLLLRLGAEDLPHFILSLYRGNYDPGYGAFQGRVILPFSNEVVLTVGGSMFQTSSLFIEPQFRFGDYSASVRVGTILNYNDAAFTRVGIFEGAFASGSVGYRW